MAKSSKKKYLKPKPAKGTNRAKELLRDRKRKAVAKKRGGKRNA